MKPRSAKAPPRGREGSVRIIGGRWRGTRLPVPDLPGLRPTSDRARETLFNWLQPVLSGARVLDLFAGSGALGLEALSRGAREALLVERDPALVESLRATVERLHADDEARPVRADALSLLRAPLHGRFDVVFVDPPFDDGLWEAVLAALPPWLADDAWLYLESPADRPIEPGAGWRLHREGRSRDARHALYRRSGGGAATLPQVPDDSATSTP
jgi:16S rRNA (guanine966-N2)-methyltransferase